METMKKTTCYRCGNETDAEFIMKGLLGETLCSCCWQECYCECDECGEVMHREDSTYLPHEQITVCQSCLDEEFISCEHCGTTVRRDNSVYVEAEDAFICERCIERHFVICGDCGEYTREGDTESVDNLLICRDCLSDHYYSCDHCGCWIHTDDTHVMEDTDQILCEECWNEHQEQSEVIRPYHTCFELRFLSTQQESSTKPLYFGIELEVDDHVEHDNRQEEAAHVLEAFEYYNGVQAAHATEDGSLNNGFELVSQPMTWDFLQETGFSMFRKATSRLEHFGYKSHNAGTCGLHVHVGRAGLGDNLDETITKIWLLMFRFTSEIIRFSRRKPAQLEHYCRPLSLDSIGAMDMEESLESLTVKVKENGRNNRYLALNLCNRDTIEFRIFRGTLNMDTFVATLQFVKEMVNYAKSHTLDEIKTVSWRDFAKYTAIGNDELTLYYGARGLLD